MMIQSPLVTDFVDEPVETTSKQPSLPATALGEEVPREVKGGFEG
jgi:hypothetical protein